MAYIMKYDKLYTYTTECFDTALFVAEKLQERFGIEVINVVTRPAGHSGNMMNKEQFVVISKVDSGVMRDPQSADIDGYVNSWLMIRKRNQEQEPEHES